MIYQIKYNLDNFTRIINHIKCICWYNKMKSCKRDKTLLNISSSDLSEIYIFCGGNFVLR